MNTGDVSRRRFNLGLAAWAMSPVKARKPYIAVQVGAVSFVDEGIDTVLDILREKAHVNTVWLNTYTWDHGTGGRQLAGYPFPDHGPQEPDEVRGGAVFDYDQKYFQHTVLNQFRTAEYKGAEHPGGGSSQGERARHGRSGLGFLLSQPGQSAKVEEHGSRGGDRRPRPADVGAV